MSETAQELGQKLKAEREKRGMSAQKMADDMHLDAWVIDALEAGDYERIGPSVYAQGHLRKYAGILGVLATQATPARETKPAGPAVPIPIIRLDPPGRGGGALWPTVASFAVIALVAGGIAWWRPWHARPAVSVRASATSLRSPARPVAAGVSEPESTATPSPVGYMADTADAGVAAEATSAGPAAAIRSMPASPTDLTPGVGRARLRLSFSADSRVAVYDYTGKSVFTGNGRANSVKTLSGMAPFRVYLGFASGVQLQVNDRAVAIGPQFVTGDVARFEAGADGVLRRDPRPMPAGAPAPASPRG
jgi:cytoskeleton protein RodZ